MSVNASASATAFAPATVANVAVGFDILGFAVAGLGDEVTVTQWPVKGEVLIEDISGVVTELPKDPHQNTAAVALLKMIADFRIPHGFRLRIKKGIPLSSGLGGSAASAVAAVVAANETLEKPLSKLDLLTCALAGEAVASGGIHADNVAPCLYGGMTLVASTEPLDIAQIPFPDEIQVVLAHPQIRVETKQARAILKAEIPLKDHIRQSAHLAGFLTGCFRNDLGLIRRNLTDILIEPQRASLIPRFAEAKQAALGQGALGFSISGAGPTLFAWAASRETATTIEQDLREVYRAGNPGVDTWISPISLEGARVRPAK